ncbi:MAG TPA: 4Fe-4S dicluster domain-containing protein [Polyangia bacterium]
MAQQRDIVLEASTKRDFIDELLTVPGGDRLRDCIQCGTCSGSCPVSYAMDHPPRKLFAMIRAGMREDVLSSESLWLCTSCYSCTERCPKGIGCTDIMYALKRIAMSEGKAQGAAKAMAFATSFTGIVAKNGRNNESSLLMRFYMKVNPFAMMRKAPLGMQLMSRGRMPLGGEKIKDKDIEQLRAIIAKTEEMGGL